MTAIRTRMIAGTVADMAARIAAAVGDPGALLAIAIELNASLSVASAELAALEKRRSSDRLRKGKERHVKSRDVTGQGVTSSDTLPPQVSSSSPTPLITPSFPPHPLPLQAPQGNAEEVRLHDRAPEAWSVIEQFVAGKEPPARMAWIGRFHGALDRPPHPTGAELRDAIGDFMTRPPEDWKPALFRRYVERIRRDAERDVERSAASPRPARAATLPDEADAAWAVVLAMVPAWLRREVTADVHHALPPATRRGLSAVGGFQRIVNTPDDKRVWVKKEFVEAYRAAPTMSLTGTDR